MWGSSQSFRLIESLLRQGIDRFLSAFHRWRWNRLHIYPTWGRCAQGGLACEFLLSVSSLYLFHIWPSWVCYLLTLPRNLLKFDLFWKRPPRNYWPASWLLQFAAWSSCYEVWREPPLLHLASKLSFIQARLFIGWSHRRFWCRSWLFFRWFEPDHRCRDWFAWQGGSCSVDSNLR